MASTQANTPSVTSDAANEAQLGRFKHASRRPSGASNVSSSTVLVDRYRRRSTASELSGITELPEHILKRGPSAADRSHTNGWRPVYNYVALAFPLLPAIATSAFGQAWGDCVKDILILFIAGYCLLWTLTAPWDWYHSARSIRVHQERRNRIQQTLLPNDTTDDTTEIPLFSDFPNDKKLASLRTKLRTHELVALSVCIALPAAAACVLHFLRVYLTYSSRALNKYNLIIFLLIATLRPAPHCITLLMSQTLCLQREVLLRQQELQELGGPEESHSEKIDPSRTGTQPSTEEEVEGEEEEEEEEEEGGGGGQGGGGQGQGQGEGEGEGEGEGRQEEVEQTLSSSATSNLPGKFLDPLSLDSKEPPQQALLSRIQALEHTTSNLTRLASSSRLNWSLQGSRQPEPASPLVHLRQGLDTEDNDAMVNEIAKHVAEMLQDNLARSMTWFERKWDAKLAALQFMGWESDDEYPGIDVHGRRLRLGKPPPPKGMKKVATSSSITINSNQGLSSLTYTRALVWGLTKDVANMTLWFVFLPLTLPRESILFGVWTYEKIRGLFGYEQKVYEEAAALLRDPRRLCKATAGFVWDAVAGDNAVEVEVESEEEEDLDLDTNPKGSKGSIDPVFPSPHRVSTRSKRNKQHLVVSRAL